MMVQNYIPRRTVTPQNYIPQRTPEPTVPEVQNYIPQRSPEFGPSAPRVPGPSGNLHASPSVARHDGRLRHLPRGTDVGLPSSPDVGR